MRDEGVHAFPKGIILKVNIIVWKEFELAYFKSALKYFGLYATRTPHSSTYVHLSIYLSILLSVAIEYADWISEES